MENTEGTQIGKPELVKGPFVEVYIEYLPNQTYYPDPNDWKLAAKFSDPLWESVSREVKRLMNIHGFLKVRIRTVTRQESIEYLF